MDFQSQYRQDRWVASLLGDKIGGTFFDLGAGDPVRFSNSVWLERSRSWRGVCADPATYDALIKDRNAIVLRDAFQIDWRVFTDLFPGGFCDFLSLDLEPPNLTLARLITIPEWCRFRIACVEHDFYRDLGEERRTIMAAEMTRRGYEYIISVGEGDMIVEDWWVDPSQIDVETAKRSAWEIVGGKHED